MAFVVRKSSFLSVLICVLYRAFVVDGDKNEQTIDIQLTDKLDAPRKSELDITNLNKQLKALIKQEVKLGIEETIKEVVGSANNELQKTGEEIKSEMENTIDSYRQTKRVAVASCASRIKNIASNEIIKFPDTKTSIGNTNLTSLKNSGKFTCEHAGLYMISVTIMSETSNKEFSIYKNSDIIGNGFIPLQNSGWHTSTVVFPTLLDVNDEIYVKNTSGLFRLYEKWSCITITKII